MNSPLLQDPVRRASKAMFALAMGWLAPMVFQWLLILLVQVGWLHRRWHDPYDIESGACIAFLSIPFLISGWLIDNRKRAGVSVGNVYCVLMLVITVLYCIAFHYGVVDELNRPPLERTMPLPKYLFFLLYLDCILAALIISLKELNKADRALTLPQRPTVLHDNV